MKCYMVLAWGECDSTGPDLRIPTVYDEYTLAAKRRLELADSAWQVSVVAQSEHCVDFDAARREFDKNFEVVEVEVVS